MEKPNLTQQIELEIKKQLQEADHRGERFGWFYIILLLVVVFGTIYAVKMLNPSTDRQTYNTQVTELQTRVDQLEQRVHQLEQNK